MNDINFNLRLQHLQNNILPYTLINLIGNQVGNGFLIKGYFITAGHCLSCGSVSFIYNKTKYTFKKEDAIFFLSDIDSSEIPMGDIAIFKFENNDKYLNTIQKLLIEGRSKNNDKMLEGRTNTNKVVIFEPNQDNKPGDIVSVKITETHKWYLKGEII